MYIDCLEAPPAEKISADVCIVGAGVAGTTLAEAFADKPFSVCVIETGSFSFSSENYDLSNLSLETQLYTKSDRFQTHSQRVIGGTGTIWNGLCREMDEDDFLPRDFVPLSGWPIRKKDLEPWYKKSRDVLKLKPKTNPLIVQGTQIQTDNFWISNERFTDRWNGKLKNQKNLTLLYNATVTDLVPDTNSTRISEVRARNLKGAEVSVKAKTVILAAGGIGTPHLLLQVGEKYQFKPFRNKWIGRCFMEHPHFEGAMFLWFDYGSAPDISWRDGRYPCFYLPTSLRQSNGALAAAYTMSSAKDHGFTTDFLQKILEHRVDKSFVEQFPAFNKALYNKEGAWYVAFLRGEQVPDERNGIHLINERNALGEKRSSLSFNFYQDDLRSIEKNSQLFVREALKINPSIQAKLVVTEEQRYSRFVSGGGHFMGTMRMAESAEQGCTDSNCQLIGADNLYIAGSSVFTTSGFSNPTQTIIALALRLAEFLEKRHF